MLRVIGDIHGNYKKYGQLISLARQSICVGDMGFDYKPLNQFDPTNHKIIGGNHDNYDIIDMVPHNLGDYGVFESIIGPIFFIRGAWSIDRAYRTAGVDWWEAEQLSYYQLQSAIKAYRASQAPIIITHEAPLSLVPHVTNPEIARSFGYDDIVPTRTNLALDTIYQTKPPKLWVFGHYHTNRVIQGNCMAICVGETRAIDIINENIIEWI